MFSYSDLVSGYSSSNFRLCWPYPTRHKDKFAFKANPAVVMYLLAFLYISVSCFVGSLHENYQWGMMDDWCHQWPEGWEKSDSLLVFSCLLEVLELLFQDLKVSYHKSQELSKEISLELNAFDSLAYTTDSSQETWTATWAVGSVV